MPLQALPSAEEVRALLNYDAETGVMIWRERAENMFVSGHRTAAGNCANWNSQHAGRVAGDMDSHGYWRISINKRRHLAHRLAWLIIMGEWPSDQIDHINGRRTDNRLSNLRTVSHQENLRNMRLSRANSSGVTGVHWDRQRGKWEARIRSGGRNIQLGRFTHLSDATTARKAAEREHGYHPNHGKTGEMKK